MIEIIVPGTPQQQGSKTQIRPHVMIEANPKLLPWRAEVIAAAQAVYSGAPINGPVLIWARFYFARPQGHYGTGKNSTVLKASAPLWHSSKPDLDKLQRALGDALTNAGVIVDDRKIAHWQTLKLYDTRPWMHCRIRPIA